MEEAKIKEKMAEITNRWKDKPEQGETATEHSNRMIDRMRYRNFQKELEKLKIGDAPKEGESTDEYADRLFGS